MLISHCSWEDQSAPTWCELLSKNLKNQELHSKHEPAEIGCIFFQFNTLMNDNDCTACSHHLGKSLDGLCPLCWLDRIT